MNRETARESVGDMVSWVDLANDADDLTEIIVLPARMPWDPCVGLIANSASTNWGFGSILPRDVRSGHRLFSFPVCIGQKGSESPASTGARNGEPVMMRIHATSQPY